MSDYYDLVSADPSPVSLADMKSFLKISNTAEDSLIQTLINSATEFGEKYTGRDFRIKTWRLLLDSFLSLSDTYSAFRQYDDRHFVFTDHIKIERDPVTTVSDIKRLVDGLPVSVTATDFYLKKLTNHSEIILFEDKEWPDDVDDREQAIEVTFLTKAYFCINNIIDAIQRHVAHLYTNRGDCDDAGMGSSDSGATLIYDQFRIARVC